MISIIIPTCKSDNLIPCLESIHKYTMGAEIIVVANGYDGEAPTNCKLVWYDQMIGYPAAINAGIAEATGEYIVLLNDDTVLLPQRTNDWVNILSAPFNDPKVAITGPWMMNNTEIQRDFICFFCCMIRKSVLDEIGLLDAETFGAGYSDDVDWCCRAVDAGYKMAAVDTTDYHASEGMGYGQFPIFHKGCGTFRYFPDKDLIHRNHAILRQRYGGVIISNAQPLGEWVTDDELRWLGRQATKSKVIVELGSWFGKSSMVLADNLPPDGVLYCIDTWAGSAAERDTNHAQAREMDGDFAYNEFIRNNWRHIESGKLKPIRMHGRHGAKLLKDMGVIADTIFIDAGHTKPEVIEDCYSLLPLLKKGGIISGHDYGRPQCPDVTEAVHAVFGGNVACNPNTTIWSTDYNPVPKIYDCFSFFNELELLEIRFNELYDAVDHFVIVEGVTTQTGKPKPLYFWENRERFKKFLPKVIHIVDDYAGVPDDVWAREYHQRAQIMQGLKDCKDNDIIIVGDADEIASASGVRSYKPEMDVAYLDMTLYYYYLNSQGSGWHETKMCSYGKLKELTPQGLRYIYDHTGSHGTIIPNGGWHFSFQGGADKVREKIRSYGHQEFNTPEILDHVEDRMAEGKDVFNREMYYKIMEVNGTHPIYVQQNLEKFKQLGFVK